jgi:cytochrome c oxidase subunit II
MAEEEREGRPALTTRRGFITAAGFGVVSLYGLWAAYGAAPLGWLAPGHGDGDAAADAAGHGGGHGGGHGAADGMSPDEFRQLAERFIEKNQLPDGSVQPGRVSLSSQPTGGLHGHAAAPAHAPREVGTHRVALSEGAGHVGHDAGSAHGAEPAHDDHGGEARHSMQDMHGTDDGHGMHGPHDHASDPAVHDMQGNGADHELHGMHEGAADHDMHDMHGTHGNGADHNPHEMHGADDHGHEMAGDHDAGAADHDHDMAAGEAHGEHAHADAIDVYLMVYKWGYAPSVLRLEANVPYRFHMMAVDSSHGASIHMGRASRMIRLPAKRLVQMEMEFKRPGEYLVYCTVYCGIAHDQMHGRIIVS